MNPEKYNDDHLTIKSGLSQAFNREYKNGTANGEIQVIHYTSGSMG